MKWYLKVLSNYNDFKGRSRRKEYWMFILFHIIVVVILTIVDIFVGTYDEETGNGIISGVYSLLMIPITFSVAWRRMHDIGKSGWYFLIPIYGQIILTTRNGDVGDNNFGSDPK